MRFLLFILAFFNCVLANGQDSTFIVNVSLNVSGSTGDAPFWIYTNKNGVIPRDKLFASGQWGVRKIYNPNDPRILQWSGGVELITNYAKKGDLFLTDAYLATKLGPVELMAGQKKNMVSLVDSTLGTGGLAVSGNARPIPRFQLSVIDFLPLAFTNDFVSVKGSYSDGLLGASNINYGSVARINQTYFHQKQLYFRIGQAYGKFKVYAGINHQAVWGGENKIRPLDNPSLPKSYWYVITGKTLNYQKVGTHFGTIDLALDFSVRNWKVFLYRNSVYESGSIFKVINLYDGLNGIRFTNKKVKSASAVFSMHSINLEYLSLNNQKNQFQPSKQVFYETADYYNSYIYQRGWSYSGLGIGTPLAPPSSLTKDNLPTNSGQFTNNNRIMAFHGAMHGALLGVEIVAKGTYSRNQGTFLTPFDITKNQLSLFLGGEKRLKFLRGTTVMAALVSDFGKLYPNSSGLILGIKKSAFID